MVKRAILGVSFPYHIYIMNNLIYFVTGCFWAPVFIIINKKFEVNETRFSGGSVEKFRNKQKGGQANLYY